LRGAAVAADDAAELGDPGGSGGGHRGSAHDDGEKQRHGQREAQVRAQEADVHGVRILDDEDQHHDEDDETHDQAGAHAAYPGVPGRALGRLSWG
jgi:hypothetical protein